MLTICYELDISKMFQRYFSFLEYNHRRQMVLLSDITILWANERMENTHFPARFVPFAKGRSIGEKNGRRFGMK